LHAATLFPAGPTLAQFLPHLGQYLISLGKQPLPAAVLAAVGAAERQLDPAIVAPCHRDLNPSNILATPEAVRLIDWELAGNSDPFFDLGELGIWVCRDDAERTDLLVKYLGRAPDPAEQRRMVLNRILALGFYASAFHMLAAMADQPVPEPGPTLDEMYAVIVETRRPEPARMSGALVRELVTEVRAQGLLS
jgi:serine/threonine protein kinase